MSGKIAQTRRILKVAIKQVCSSSWMFVRNLEKGFTRKRKISFQDILLLFLCKEGGNLTTELFRYFKLIPDFASISAFIQQRDKILPEAFITLFHLFTQKACLPKLYKGLRLLAADDSDIQIPTDSYFPGSANQEPYNLLHLNALYDLNTDVYIDADVDGKRCCTEVRSLCKMVDRSSVERALVIADRGYESYNLMAHMSLIFLSSFLYADGRQNRSFPCFKIEIAFALFLKPLHLIICQWKTANTTRFCSMIFH